ncbi:MAG: hypothetical protein LBI11_00665 [Streptococcaceae bacterium]|nr:hypothetical protein [Streptococcaceae bacterium]
MSLLAAENACSISSIYRLLKHAGVFKTQWEITNERKRRVVDAFEKQIDHEDKLLEKLSQEFHQSTASIRLILTQAGVYKKLRHKFAVQKEKIARDYLARVANEKNIIVKLAVEYRCPISVIYNALYEKKIQVPSKREIEVCCKDKQEVEPVKSGGSSGYTSLKSAGAIHKPKGVEEAHKQQLLAAYERRREDGYRIIADLAKEFGLPVSSVRNFLKLSGVYQSPRK